MRNVRFDSIGWKEFTDWQFSDPKLWKKIVELINESARTPFEGRGKPEPLKGNYRGYWSRRIDREHRLIYRPNDEEILIFRCRGHYS